MKTLKDLDTEDSEDISLFKLELKHEASKWVKELEERLEKSGHWEFNIDGLRLYGEPNEGHDAQGMIIAFKHFFNLKSKGAKK